MAVTTANKPTEPAADATDAGIRISDAATRAGVSARTLRYYEELGLLTPSLYTAGGERRYTLDDLAHLERILELREVLGMNLDEIREFLTLETRLDEVKLRIKFLTWGWWIFLLRVGVWCQVRWSWLLLCKELLMLMDWLMVVGLVSGK